MRLEPVFMQLGEAAGLAVALAQADHVALADLAPDRLVRALCARRSMVTFFNDIDVAATEPWVAAVQYFGTKGFFHDYDARAGEEVRRGTALLWVEAAAKCGRPDYEPDAVSAAVLRAAAGEDAPITAAEFAALLSGEGPNIELAAEAKLTRGQALQWLWMRLT